MKNAVLFSEAERALLGPGSGLSEQPAWPKRQSQLLATVVGPWTPCSTSLCMAVAGVETLLASAGYISRPGK